MLNTDNCHLKKFSWGGGGGGGGGVSNLSGGTLIQYMLKTIMNMHLFIEKRLHIFMLYNGNYIEVKIFSYIYKLEIDKSRNISLLLITK